MMRRRPAAGMKLMWLVAGVALFFPACDPTETAGSTSTTAAPTTTARVPETSPAPSTSSTLPSTTAADDESPPCATGDLPFVSDGQVGGVGDGAGDAAQVAGFRWSIEEECERFVVDFATAGGAPAAVLGTTGVTFLAERGVIRAELPGLEFTTVVADALVESPLLDRVFVVGLRDGTTAVDVHLAARAEIRVLAVTSPARLVFDVRAVTGPPIEPPTTDSGVVLMQPSAGNVLFPLGISGYVAPGVRSVTASLPPFGETAPQASAEISGDGVLWNEFVLVIPIGPPGLIDLTVETNTGVVVTVPIQQS